MIDPINIIQGEVYGLISNLKLNSRWSYNNSSYHDTIFPENPILRSLKNLTNILHNITDFKLLDTCVYLEPFLSVIKSNQTSGFITGAALTSVNKFLTLFINEESNNIHKGIRDIAEAAAHCKFEATDARSDEIVLMKILQVLISCVKNPAGIFISNELIYEVTVTCYHMSDQSRSSELLKKMAENAIQEIISTIFTRYNVFTSPPPPPPPPPPSDSNNSNMEEQEDQNSTVINNFDEDLASVEPPPIPQDEPDSANTTVDFSPNNDLFFSNLPVAEDSSNNNNEQQPSNQPPPLPTPAQASQPKVQAPPSPTPVHVDTSANNSNSHKHHQKANSLNTVTSPTLSNNTQQPSQQQPTFTINPRGVRFDSSNATEKPYDETVLIKLFKFFTNNIASPNTQDDMSKLLCLNLINTIVQIRGELLESIPEILTIIQQELFRFLLLNLQQKSVQIYSLSMRIFFNLFISLKRTLKSQFEAFFNVLMVSIQENNKNHYELQELALEGLRDFCKLPHTMVDLFVNYDCELHCSNVFENLCKFLYKNSFPISQSITSLHLLSFENLLSIVQSIEDRRNRTLNDNGANNNNKIDYLKKKEIKKQLIVAAEHFNRSPKDALEYLKNNNLYSPITEPLNIAKFLLEVPKLNKTQVGEYLGKRGPFNERVRHEYISSFNLKNPNCMQIFREFLESFKIPGDSAVVMIIFEQFAQLIYENRTDNLFTSADNVYLYIYSGLMLHTSIFNPSIPTKDRMNFQSFKQMLYKDLPLELIQECFDDIFKSELILEEEPVPGVINNGNWRNILKRSKRIGDYIPANTNDYDREIFSIVLNLVIPAISKVFEKIENESLCQRILDGFQLCAQVSANYNIIEVIDNLMTSLCNNTNLIDTEQVLATTGSSNSSGAGSGSGSINASSGASSSSVSSSSYDYYNTSGGNNSSSYNGNGAFIGDNKAQLATIATFEIAIKYSSLLGESWRFIIAIICKLNKMDLLDNIFETIDFPIENKNNNKKEQEPQKSKNTSSNFLSFKWFITEEDEEVVIDPYREKAKTCIDNCHITDLFQETKSLPMHSLDHLLQSLFIITNPSKSQQQPQSSSLSLQPSSSSASSLNNSSNSITPSNNSAPNSNLNTPPQNHNSNNTTPTTINNTNSPSIIPTNNIANTTTATTTNIIPITTHYYSINQKQELFCFDLLSHIILLNQERLGLVWKKYFEHCELIINIFEQVVSVNSANSRLMIPLIEKIVVSIMYLIIRLLDKKEVLDTLQPFVKVLIRIGPVLDNIAEKMSISLIQLVKNNIKFISKTPEAWEPIIALVMLLSGNPKSSSRACEALTIMINQDYLTPQFCKYCLEPITCFLSSKTIPPSVVVKSMELLYFIFNSINKSVVSDIQKINSLTNGVEAFKVKAQLRKVDDKIKENWGVFWSPILKKFAALCLDSKNDIRNNAMTYLQKTILSPTLEEYLPPQRWIEFFVDIFFPLLDSLKENSKETNFEDTRLRASALLSKVFLQNLNTIIKSDQFTLLWTYILSFLKVYMGLSELLSESVPESLKNMLLVMNNSGVFKPPVKDDTSSSAQISEHLWNTTWSTIKEFCPKISDDVLSRVDPNHLKQAPPQPLQQNNSDNDNNNNSNTNIDNNSNENTNIDNNSNTNINNTPINTNVDNNINSNNINSNLDNNIN
ncbi:hypothetical protein DICPUDRAFT_96890 [Dictyostelium purpureum]|uniref:SEC7 domain-containing protein n=1 Tax=Dictyostelium purpureum TaxID=5786 RepID=F0ZC34_DICPU|nr:uncharacterized protein DICPUDRAFT_96890 [Dictyostelium purpureum]EGC38505.1 hypothetical protein DICPUDRAFT_96890 [Dictyostelium purpureum]|eukprot:XP_003284970.1 hypothetical protein DICPUDRAFT_96890 [Dictyostelium purpureum]